MLKGSSLRTTFAAAVLFATMALVAHSSLAADADVAIRSSSIDPSMGGTVAGMPCMCQVDMIPDNPPVQVAPGGYFTYTGILENGCHRPMTIDVWVMVQLPDNTLYGPVQLFENVIIGANQVITEPNIVQHVPNTAPPGNYNYVAFCGRYPYRYRGMASFPFRIIPGGDGSGATGWNLSAWFDENRELPSETSLLGNYPNPFNAQTTINFNLPEAGAVNLSVYNLMGQKVVTLIDSELPAGEHSVIWDGSNAASGVYFYKLQIGDEVTTRKMNLLK
jgi:hypothetical protein